MAISTTSANTALDAVLTAGDYLALHTANPDPSGSSEVTGGSYSRKSLAYGTTSNKQKANSAVIDFAGMPAATVTHVAVWSAATGGTMKWSGAVSASKTYQAGDTAQVKVGSLTATIS